MKNRPVRKAPKNTLIDLGLRISRARGEIPRTVLAFRLGVSWSLVYKWERGLCWPKVVDILELSRALGVTINFFLEGIEGPSVEQALLDLKLISERDLLEARAYCFKNLHGSQDPQFPDWRVRNNPDGPPEARD